MSDATIKIEKLVYGGKGLARDMGRVVMTPFVMPGEEVIVGGMRERKGLLDAGLEQVVQASPERVEPQCPVFMKCGGCHYQHMSYASQVEAKSAILAEVLERGGVKYEDRIATIFGEPWAYRNRTQFHFSEGKVGFRAAQSRKLIPLEGECPVSAPLINAALKTLRGLVKQKHFPRFLHSMEFFTNGEQVQVNVTDTAAPIKRSFFDWCGKEIRGAISGAIEYESGGDQFRVSHQSFFQVNRFLVDALTQATIDGLQGNYAVDLYAGVGLFSLPLMRKFARVEAVESGGAAMHDLKHNAKRAGSDVRCVQADTLNYLQDVTEKPDVIIADPPRSGLGMESARELVRLRTPQLRLVSCDPATLARDLKILAEVYRMTKVTMIDLFPQTFHIESIVELELR
jgi:23S rRNA (uracil1939-C5)-methyltransferase